METWQAKIKEKGNDHILTPTYMIPNDMFGYIKPKEKREEMTRKYLVDFWGLNEPDVEWYKLEKLAKEE